MLQRFSLIALAMVTALAVSGCGGATPDASSVICVMAPAPPMLIYPADGATAIPDGNFTLAVTGGSQTVDLAIGTTIVLSNLSPTGAVSVSTPPGSAYGYAVPALKPLTTYSVMTFFSRSGCYDPKQVSSRELGSIGSFTTK